MTEKVDTTADIKKPINYLPQHPLVLEDQETRKVGVVFDVSSKLKAQPPFNNILYSGSCLIPFLQELL